MINSWIGLLKKEYRLSKVFVFTWFIILISSIILVNIFMENQSANRFAIASIILILHVIYLPLYMFYSLRVEADHLHLWLHSSHPARNLILAKLLNGLLSFLISLSISISYLYITIKNLGDFGINSTAIALNATFIGYSIYLSMWVVFIWVIYQVIKKIAGRFTWLIFVGLVTFGFWLMDIIRKSNTYEILTDWGRINLPYINYSLEEGLRNTANINIHIEEVPHIDLGVIFSKILIILGLFFLSSWLIDKKVEV